MPKRAKTICRYPGCGQLIDAPGYCRHHLSCPDTRKQIAERLRKSAYERGYTHGWHKARTLFLKTEPLCVTCHHAGKITAATVVDHIVAHKGDQRLFWDQSNWQPLCTRCHSQKTTREDGGFGNRIHNLNERVTQ